MRAFYGFQVIIEDSLRTTLYPKRDAEIKYDEDFGKVFNNICRHDTVLQFSQSRTNFQIVILFFMENVIDGNLNRQLCIFMTQTFMNSCNYINKI